MGVFFWKKCFFFSGEGSFVRQEPLRLALGRVRSTGATWISSQRPPFDRADRPSIRQGSLGLALRAVSSTGVAGMGPGGCSFDRDHSDCPWGASSRQGVAGIDLGGRAFDRDHSDVGWARLLGVARIGPGVALGWPWNGRIGPVDC